MMTMLMKITWVPNNKQPSWAKAKKTVKNMTPNPATSPAQRARVLKMTMKMMMVTMHDDNHNDDNENDANDDNADHDVKQEC